MNYYFKKTVLVMAILTSTMLSFSSAKAQSVTMDVEFSSALHPAGTKLKLYREWPKRVLLDTGSLNSQNKYVLHLRDSLPAVFTLEARKPFFNQTIILETGVCTITLRSDSQVVVQAGVLQNKLEQYLKLMKPLEKEWAATGTKYTKAKDLEEKLIAERENKVIAEKVQSARMTFIKNNLNNSLSQWITFHNINLWQQKELKILKNWFLPTKSTNYVSTEIENRLQVYERSLLVGKKAPSFALPAIHGNLISLDELLKNNKYVLIDFWASWCTPCRATNRNIAPLYADLKRKGIEVVSISVDENNELWKKAVQSDQIPWPQLISATIKSKAALDYNVKTLPSTFLIDKEGIVVKQGVEIEELKSMILPK